MIGWLATHGVELALAMSATLAVGALGVWRTRAPHLRHRTAELTLAITVLAGVVVLAPLPRPDFVEAWLPQPAQPVVEVATNEVTPQPWRPIPAIHMPVEGRAEATLEERLIGETVSARTPQPVATAPKGTSRVPIGLAPFFLVGALLLCAHGLIASLLLQRLLRRAKPAPDWVHELLPDRSLRVLVSGDSRRPFCCGLRHGSIVLPRALVRRDWAGRLEAVLRHERAHLDQGHPRARALATALAPLLYWQPLYWWLARDLRRNAELLADDMATRDFDKRRYVQALLDLADHTRRTGLAEAHGVGAWNAPKEFLERMEKLIMRTRPYATRLTAAQFVTRTGCALVLVSSVSLAWGPVLQDVDAGATELPLLATVPILSDVFDEPFEETSATAETPVNDPIAAVHDPRDPLAASPQDATHKVHLEFEAHDATALGALLMELGNARVELLRVDHDPHARLVRAEVEGMSDESLMRFTQIDGLLLVSIAVGGPWNPGPSTGTDPVQTDAATTKPRITNYRAAHSRAKLEGTTAAEGPLTSQGTPNAEQDLRARLDQIEQQLADLSAVLAHVRKAQQGPRIDALRMQPAQPMVGHVVNVRSEGIAINLGSNHGVRVGTSFEVYNGSFYKGRVVVTELSEETCVAKPCQQVEGRSIEPGDNVTDRL